MHTAFFSSLKSSGFLFINDKKGALTDETLYTIMPNDTFMLDTVPNQKHELYLVRFHIYAMLHDEITPISQEKTKSLLNAWQFVHTDAFDQIHYSLSQMIDLWKKNDSVHSFQCQLLFQSVDSQTADTSPAQGGDTAQALLKTKQYINDHSDEPIPPSHTC
ncbi:hypothetical protein ACEQPO_30195 [Bacillus sp. SL00103]